MLDFIVGRVKYNLLRALCLRQSPEKVMAPAVADPKQFGYKKMYIALLEQSKRSLRKIMELCADESNYPLLIHCIHGKDRTGIVVMLLLMLCDVEHEAIVADYVRSEQELCGCRCISNLTIEDYLMKDNVISANADYIEGAILHIERKYGNIRNYMKSLKVSESTMEKIRTNLMK
eukprot:TRINITY_DN31843_c0_g2_i1.p3 TRINITY_DN31843_c0_g2~~TRINITY_DN31843_c0_g2_i1.p3  ORF type:complete len:175 (+),score=2.09 TRINITY_DN31843_c0_g2_i1:3-527(+)